MHCLPGVSANSSHCYSVKHFLNEKAYRDIKTKKGQKQDWDGTLATKVY